MAPPPLRTGQTLVRGSAWVGLEQVVSASSGLVTSIIAARLLSPDAFGLMGLALLTMATLNAVSQTGFDRALIQRKDADGYLDVAFTVQVVRGALLCIFLLLIAWPISIFYDEPDLVGILAVMGVSVFAGGFRNIATVFFQRSLDFRTVAIFGVAKSLAKFGAVLALLFSFRNVWALVLGHLAGALVDLALSYAVQKERPRLAWDKRRATELLRFGKWLTGMAILGLIVTRGDDMFIGKYLGIAAVGLYGFAYEIANLPATNVTHVVGKVSFPTYAHLCNEGDQAAIRQAFFNVMKATLLITGPLSVLIYMGIESVVVHVFGAQWMGIIPLVRILVVAGFIRSVAALATGMFQGAGMPHLDFWMNLPRFLLLTFLIWPVCALDGLRGASVLSLAAVSACLPTWLYGLRKIAGITWRELARESALAGCASLIVGLSYRLSTWAVQPTTLMNFGLQIGICALLSGASMWGLGKVSRLSLANEINSLSAALRTKA